MVYVLKEEPISKNESSSGYYTGESYCIQGERYYVFLEDVTKAKKYSSRARAEKAVESIGRWSVMYRLVVEEVEE